MSSPRINRRLNASPLPRYDEVPLNAAKEIQALQEARRSLYVNCRRRLEAVKSLWEKYQDAKRQHSGVFQQLDVLHNEVSSESFQLVIKKFSIAKKYKRTIEDEYTRLSKRVIGNKWNLYCLDVQNDSESQAPFDRLGQLGSIKKQILELPKLYREDLDLLGKVKQQLDLQLYHCANYEWTEYLETQHILTREQRVDMLMQSRAYLSQVEAPEANHHCLDIYLNEELNKLHRQNVQPYQIGLFVALPLVVPMKPHEVPSTLSTKGHK